MTEALFEDFVRTWALALTAEVAGESPRISPNAPDPGRRDRPLPAAAVPAPPPPPATAMPRLREMENALLGLEDKLQGSLIAIKLATEVIQEKQREIQRLRAALVDLEDPLDRLTLETALAHAREDVSAAVRSRDELITGVFSLMEDALKRVGTLRESMAFGELTARADRIVQATRIRSDFLRMQTYLLTGEGAKLRDLALEVKSRSFQTGTGLYFEALSDLLDGNPVRALSNLRSARGYGLGGGAFDTFERQIEIQLLHTIQARATAASEEFEKEYERWIAAKAETNLDPNKSRFGWLVERGLWRGWYDTISGLTPAGIGEAAARGREMGVVKDDMAQLHIGLGLIAGLREAGFSLQQIKNMDGIAFRAAMRKAADRDIPEEDLDRLRRMLVRAFTEPSLRKLASGEELTGPENLAADLAPALKSPGWATAAEYAAWGGNFATGWQVLVTLLPSARASWTVGLQGAGQVRETMTMAEWFASSRPAVEAMSRLSGVPGGQKILASLTILHRWSNRSLARGMAVGVGSALLEAGLAHAASAYLGEDAKYLVDALQMIGLTTPEFYAEAFRAARIPAREARRMAARIAAASRETAESIQTVRAVAEKAWALIDGGAAPATLRALREELEALPGLPDELRLPLRESLEHAERGTAAAARESMHSYERLAENAQKTARAGEEGARALENAAAHIPDEPPRQPSTSGTPAAPAASRSLPADSPRFLTQQPDAFTHNADRLVAQGRFEEAAVEYQKLLAKAEGNERIAAAVRTKLVQVEAAIKERAALERLRLQAPTPPRVRTPETGDPISPGLLEDIREAARNGYRTPPEGPPPLHLEAVGEPLHLQRIKPPEEATTADPSFVIGREGKPIAVVKKALGSSGHEEGIAEELASRIFEVLGRPGPRSRVVQLTVEGKTEKYIVTQLFPHGTELRDLSPTTGQLLARKEDLAEDLVYSLFLGDGDRHLGNYRVLDSGETLPFDYGLADLFPEHAQYRVPADVREAQEVLARPGISPKMREQLEKLEFARQLYYDPRFSTPPPIDSPEFKEFVRGTMEKHLAWATRGWSESGQSILQSAVRFEEMAPHIRELQEVRQTLPRILDLVMKNHPQRGYTQKLLETRLEPGTARYKPAEHQSSSRQHRPDNATQHPRCADAGAGFESAFNPGRLFPAARAILSLCSGPRRGRDQARLRIGPSGKGGIHPCGRRCPPRGIGTRIGYVQHNHGSSGRKFQSRSGGALWNLGGGGGSRRPLCQQRCNC